MIIPPFFLSPRCFLLGRRFEAAELTVLPVVAKEADGIGDETRGEDDKAEEIGKHEDSAGGADLTTLDSKDWSSNCVNGTTGAAAS